MKEESEKINCPKIKESLAFFECRVAESIETGDHTLFVARVVNEGFNAHGKRPFHIHTDRFTTTVD